VRPAIHPTRFSSRAHALAGRAYATSEEAALRRSQWLATDARIAEHNALGAAWTMGHNQFSDLSPEEFSARYASGAHLSLKLLAARGLLREASTPLLRAGLLRGGGGGGAPAPLRVHTPPSGRMLQTPSSVNWVTAGGVTGVKNQGQCGTCWSFSAVAALEGAAFAATGVLPGPTASTGANPGWTGLSEQQLLDCSTNGGNNGCNGGCKSTPAPPRRRERGARICRLLPPPFPTPPPPPRARYGRRI
jgi:hypothetical protein